MKGSQFVIRIPFHFDEYRRKQIFIDCSYTINHKTYNVHKIVLSKFSKLYFKYFAKNINSSTVPIPFCADNFNFMIDFFYTGKFHYPAHRTENLIYYLAMSVVYEAETFYSIFKQIVDEFLTGNSDIKDILNLTSQFKNLHLNVIESKHFPNIDDNFLKINEEQEKFIPLLIHNYDKITKDGMNDLFQSVTPFLLSEILKRKQFSNEVNAQIIDDYVTQTNIYEKDKEYLQEVINWNDKKAYLLFLNNKMEWVKPEISRCHIERMLNARSVSTQSFIDVSKELRSNNVNNWWAIRQTQFIYSSLENEQPEIEAFNYIGSIGSLKNAYYNPISFHLVEANSSNNLPLDEDFGVQQIFNNDSDSYYLSNPSDNDINPYIEVSFIKAKFNIHRIVIDSMPRKMSPKTIKITFDEKTPYMVDMNDNSADYEFDPPIEANKIMVRMIEPVALSLRVKSLKIYGKFDKEVSK